MLIVNATFCHINQHIQTEGALKKHFFNFQAFQGTLFTMKTQSRKYERVTIFTFTKEICFRF